MAANKESVVSKIKADLDWLKDRAEEIKREVESEAYDEIKDRKVTLMGAHGPAEKIVATKEVVQKARREALKEYAQLLELINQIEERDEAKQEGRGGKALNERQLRLINKNS